MSRASPLAPVQFAGLVTIAIGLAQCVLGYRTFRALLAIVGFCTGAGAVGSLAIVSERGGLAEAIAAVLGGIVGAPILWSLYVVGVFILGALAGGLIGAALGATASSDGATISLAVTLGITGGVAALYIPRFLIIVSPAFGGSANMMLSAAWILAPEMGRNLSTHALRSLGLNARLLCIVIAIAGLLLQYSRPTLPTPAENPTFYPISISAPTSAAPDSRPGVRKANLGSSPSPLRVAASLLLTPPAWPPPSRSIRRGNEEGKWSWPRGG